MPIQNRDLLNYLYIHIVFTLAISILGLNLWAHFYQVEFRGLILQGLLSSENLINLAQFIIIPVVISYLLLCLLSYCIVGRDRSNFVEVLNSLLQPFYWGLLLSVIIIRPFMPVHIVAFYEWNIETAQIYYISALVFIVSLIIYKLSNVIFKLLDAPDAETSYLPKTTYQSKNHAVFKYHYVFFAVLLVIYVAFLMFESEKYFFVNRNIDLAMYSQTIWNIANGNGFMHTVQGIPASWWGVHFQPVLYIYSLLSHLDNFIRLPLLLNFTHIVLVVSGAVPIYLISIKKFNSIAVGLLLSISYLLYYPMLFVLIGGFQMDTIGVSILIWAFFCFDSSRKKLAFLLFALAVLHKEELALMASSTYLYLCFRRQEKFRSALIYASIFFIYYIAAKFVVQHNASPEIATFSQHYGYLGNGILSMVLGAIKHPVLLFKGVFSLHKLTNLILISLPFMFIIFISIDFIIIAFPLLALVLLSSSSTALVFYHVVVWFLFPILIALFAYIYRLRLNENKSYLSLPIAVFVSAILCNVFWGPFGFNVPQLYRHVNYDETNSIAINKLKQKIPRTDSISTPINQLINSFTKREKFYPFPPLYNGDRYTYSADHIIINSGYLAYNTQWIRILRDDHGYVVNDVVGLNYIFEKGEAPKYLLDIKYIDIPISTFSLTGSNIVNNKISPLGLDTTGLAELSIDNRKLLSQENTDVNSVFYAIKPWLEVGSGCSVKIYFNRDSVGARNANVTTGTTTSTYAQPVAITRLVKGGKPFVDVTIEMSVDSRLSKDYDSCKMFKFQLLRIAPKMAL